MRTTYVNVLMDRNKVVKTIIDLNKIYFVQKCKCNGEETACVGMNGETLILDRISANEVLRMLGYDNRLFFGAEGNAFEIEDD